ncbi:hypothetical protein D3C79_1044120 [compost metagenome]
MVLTLRCCISLLVTTDTEAGVLRMLVATLPPTHSSLATTELASSSALALTLALMMTGARR